MQQPQKPQYLPMPPPNWVLPPLFRAPPPIPAGVAINSQWHWHEAGFWQPYDPTYHGQQQQQYVGWTPSSHSRQRRQHQPQQQHPKQQQQQRSSQSHNPYKRVPRPPSAEYLASRLLDNPLGLSNMIPAEELFERSQTPPEEIHTPWIWNPAELTQQHQQHQQHQQQQQQQKPSSQSHNPYKRVPRSPSVEYLTSQPSGNPLGLSNMIPAEKMYEQSQTPPEEIHTPWIWNPSELTQQPQQRPQSSSQSHNPYKRVPRSPSAEYLTSQLSSNPPGLSNMIPVGELYEQSQTPPEEIHTPWIHPSELTQQQQKHQHQQHQHQQHQHQQHPPSQSYNPYKRVPRPPSAEYLASQLSDNPLGLSNMIPAEELYEQSPSEEIHTPWIWNPAELANDKDESSTPSSSTELQHTHTDPVISPSEDQEPESFTSKRNLRPTFSPNIIRTPKHYLRVPSVTPSPSHSTLSFLPA